MASLAPAISHNDFSQPALAEALSNGSLCLLRPRGYPSSISLVMPMYNEEKVIPILRPAITAFLDELPTAVEVVLVNDGSADRTLLLISEWAKDDRRIKVLQLARNFGHQAAATAGLDAASGEAVVLMDADLQDPLPVIHEMICRYCDGYDVVYGQRAVRQGETATKRVTAWLFYRLMRRFVYKNLPADAGDFRLMSRECLNSLQHMRETHRFLRGMVSWVGYAQCAVRYQRAPRAAGETKYPLSKMLAFAWTAATSFSILPLQLSLYLGLIVGLFGLEEAARAIFEKAFGFVVPGWTSLMIVVSLIGGATLMCLAILGQYVGMIYEQSKGRPIYLVAQVFQASPTSDNSAATGQSTAGRSILQSLVETDPWELG
jgi:dolichol-phosphate mannosyltransferase